MPDPLSSLRLPATTLQPRPEFADDLRRRIETALGRPPTPTPGGAMSDDRPAQLPAHVHAVNPYLCCDGARRAIDWYVDIFGATLEGEIIGMDGSVVTDDREAVVGHAGLRIGDSSVMLSDEWPEGGVLSPTTLGGAGLALVVYVPDSDTTYTRAVEAGATAQRPVEDQPYGDRSGWLIDPFGHRWNVATPLGNGRAVPAAPAATSTTSTDGGAGAGVPLGYFTIGSRNLEQARRFYGQLFGWDVNEGGHIANVSPPGGIAAGEDPPKVTLYFRVDDAEAMAARVRELGGEAGELQNFPSGGNVACRDDQGAPFDLWQPAPGY